MTDALADSPRARVRALSKQIGETEVARWCADLLSGLISHDDPHRPPIEWLGGRHAAALGRRPQSRELDYFPRVWAARGLLYAWTPEAPESVIGGLADPAWRVREMCAKVVRVRGIREARPRLERLEDDSVARVRAAATRALDSLS